MVHPVVVAAALQTGTTAMNMGADALERLQVRARYNPKRTNSTWYEHPVAHSWAC